MLSQRACIALDRDRWPVVSTGATADLSFPECDKAMVWVLGPTALRSTACNVVDEQGDRSAGVKDSLGRFEWSTWLNGKRKGAAVRMLCIRSNLDHPVVLAHNGFCTGEAEKKPCITHRMREARLKLHAGYYCTSPVLIDPRDVATGMICWGPPRFDTLGRSSMLYYVSPSFPAQKRVSAADQTRGTGGDE